MYFPNRSSRAIFLRLALALAVCGVSFAALCRQAKWFGAHASPALSGTRSVCLVGRDYPNLTVALADIQLQGLDGALILELAGSYTSAGETFPLTFTNLTGASATNTLTVRPASGASGLAITSADATATVNLAGAQFVTFDGRAGGAGT